MTERKDIMAPDNEPTDEELAVVMREARDEAVRKAAIADEALAARIRAAILQRSGEIQDRPIAK